MRCHMFLCADWANTPIPENIPNSLGDIEVELKLNKSFLGMVE